MYTFSFSVSTWCEIERFNEKIENRKSSNRLENIFREIDRKHCGFGKVCISFIAYNFLKKRALFVTFRFLFLFSLSNWVNAMATAAPATAYHHQFTIIITIMTKRQKNSTFVRVKTIFCLFWCAFCSHTTKYWMRWDCEWEPERFQLICSASVIQIIRALSQYKSEQKWRKKPCKRKFLIKHIQIMLYHVTAH